MRAVLRKNGSFQILFLLTLLTYWTSAIADATTWRMFKVIDRSLLIETQVEGLQGYSVLNPTTKYNYIDSDWLRSNLSTLQQQSAARGVNRKNPSSWGIYVHRPDGPNSYTGIKTQVLGIDAELGDLLGRSIGVPDAQLEIGSSVSDNFIFQFDFRTSRVRLLTRESIDLKSASNIATRAEPRLGFPSVEVRLTKRKSYWLAIQPVEEYGVSVERYIAARHGWLNGNTRLNPTPPSPQYSQPALEFMLPSIFLGETELENVTSATPLTGGLMKRNRNLNIRYCPHTFCRSVRAKGMIGQDILKHFVVTVDFREGLVRFDTNI